MKIEDSIQTWLIREKKTLALAESCTGGQVSALLVAVPGASGYFLGSLVTYSNQMKQEILGVKEKTLNEFGAVSGETALEMLEGVFARTSADIAVSVTGVAGPTGGSPEKPVGTVWVAIGNRGHESEVKRFVIEGNRQEIILKASNQVLKFLFDVLSHSS